ncbi:MFS transporter [Cognatiluteimonas weifangensis]|uniref:MFS transporter n=1 Tax=Cognatiluteimonas weifangensis TaxID=2303539 RepID=A0A372DPZ0_9GAMM|nr:MFS transporter [Luteimonas weifangensis]RFP61641.1 MFS transporter [Luteimonas weifangensis]
MSTTAATAPAADAGFVGNDRLLFGMILGVVTFWLFAQTTLNIAPDMQRDLGIAAGTMNNAVAMAALFSGIFIVVMGGLADRLGRMRILRTGFVLGIAGSLLVGLAPSGALAAPMLLLGRAVQGLSAACIMPASLALVKAYWDGAGRQRAVSLWSIGSWGGSGLAALFGGYMAQSLGWRWIFFISVAVSLLGLWLVRGTPESKAAAVQGYRFDLPGVIAFMVAMVALQVLVTQGSTLGWGSPLAIGLAIAFVVAAVAFFRIEAGNAHGFVDFRLFRNRVYTGATLSNFLVNATVGMQLVSLQLVQVGGGMSAQQAGLLTLGYAIAIIAFIRVGEKLLQRFGPRKPMVWGCAITGVAIACLMPTNIMLDAYRVVAVAGYTLFGLGLAFYATPSTDAALSSLPMDQSGAGAGIYKMASSLGAALGVAVSGAIFTALGAAGEGIRWLEGVITFQGRVDNLAVREAAMVALGFNLLMVAVAIASILLTIPAGKRGK